MAHCAGMNTQSLIARIERHCSEAGISTSTFGVRVVNDGKLVGRLREGRTITLNTLEQIEAALRRAAVDEIQRLGEEIAEDE